ncbi:hypothetical protein ElyMa_006974100 [Elysia marginata]|uniref:Uncharacterized protein n=1 Tax=Elysia marginata TaxID=1093978 RepID=A0AAV4JNQ3_9GAST|nr:hypothetical protein ElyMa_006974100 [Elysia marginata]
MHARSQETAMSSAGYRRFPPPEGTSAAMIPLMMRPSHRLIARRLATPTLLALPSTTRRLNFRRPSHSSSRCSYRNKKSFLWKWLRRSSASNSSLFEATLLSMS